MSLARPRWTALAAVIAFASCGALHAVTTDPSGDLDIDVANPAHTGFSVDGKANLNRATIQVGADARAVFTQGTKIVVGANAFNGLFRDYATLRVNADGTADNTFANGGIAELDMGGDDLILDAAQDPASGRICVGGINGAGGSSNVFGIVCYTKDGQLDPGWNANVTPGISRVNFPAVGGASASNVGRMQGMTFDRSHRLIAVGWADFPTGPQQSERDQVVARFKVDGTLDTTFDGDGWQRIDYHNGTGDRAFDVAVIKGATVAQDKIVVVGTKQSNNEGTITMLLDNGSLDTSFHGTGKFTDTAGNLTQYRSVATQSDGHMVITGQGSGGFVVVRYDAGATASTSYSVSNNTSGGSGNDVGQRVLVDASDSVYACGSHTPSSGVGWNFQVVRLTSTLGAGVANTWNVQTDFNGDSDQSFDLALDSNGKVVVVGTSSGAIQKVGVARYNPADGSLDQTFDVNPPPGLIQGEYQAKVTGGGSAELTSGMALQGDDKIVTTGLTASGNGDWDLAVARINADTGTLDTGFSGDGWDTYAQVAGSPGPPTVAGSYDAGQAIAVDPTTQKVVVVGSTSASSTSGYVVLRYNTNGSRDGGFGNASGAVVDSWNSNSEGKAVAVRSDSKVIVGGDDPSNSGFFAFARYNSGGTLDSGFNSTGKQTVKLGSSFDSLHAIALDGSNNIVAAGGCGLSVTNVHGTTTYTRMCLTRVLANGGVDPAIGTKIYDSMPGDTDNDDTAEIRSIAIAPDGKIVATGQRVVQALVQGTYKTKANWFVARFNTNETLDASFGTGGITVVDPLSTVGDVGSANIVVLQHDEKLIVVGESSQPDTINTGYFLPRQTTVARFNWDGTLDLTYGTNGWRVTTIDSDPGEFVGAAVYPLTSSRKGRAIASSFSITADFSFGRFREDPAPITGAGAPDLVTSSDSGRSNSDNITNFDGSVAKPLTFTGTCGYGETVYLLVNGSQTSPRSRALCPAPIGGTSTYTVTLAQTLSGNPASCSFGSVATATDCPYDITAFSSSGIDDSSASGALTIHVDTVVNAPTITAPVANSNTNLPHPAISGGGAEPAAQVDVTEGANAVCSDNAATNYADLSGNWSCNSSLKQGSHTIGAKQTDIAGNTSSATSESFSIRIPTTTGVTSNHNPSVYGQSVTFTATVTPDATYSADITAALTGGAVHFSVDCPGASCITGNATLNASGQATFTPSGLGLEVGNHHVHVVYDGDTNNWVGSAGDLTPDPPGQVVNKADTTTTVQSSANPSVWGQQVTFTATVAVVSPGGGTPGGTVIFTLDGVAQPASTLDAAGKATLQLSTLEVSPPVHTVSVAYQGSNHYNTSNPASDLQQTVNQALTTTNVSSSKNPSTRGENVTFTITVAAVLPGAGTPTGPVDVIIDGSTVASPTLSSGSATYQTSTLAAGPHTVSASYPDASDTHFQGSTGALGSAQQVNKGSSNITVVSDHNPADFGQLVTFTASVTPVGPTTDTPTGTVTFTIQGQSPSTVGLDATGHAMLQSSTLPVGSHTVSVTYNGDGNLLTSTNSLASPQVINPPDTTTTLGASPASPSVSGQTVSFTATVSVVPPGIGTPTGHVDFAVDGGAATPVTLASGQAIFSTSTLPVGPHTITASYVNVDGNYKNSASAGFPYTVGQASTSTALVSSANPAPQGADITFTATITVQLPGTGTPTGNVQLFFDGSASASDTQPLSSGTATFHTSTHTPGTHQVKATYVGDSNFKTSSGNLAPDQVVQPMDFGDAPPPYPTLLADNGARHVIGGPLLGAIADSEADAVPDANATGDDLNPAAGPDDEDGVAFTTPIVPAQNAGVTITATAAGKIDAWLDFNHDGDWSDPGEQIFTGQAVVAGPNNLQFAVPAGIDANATTFARFRISAAGGLAATGSAPDGEVEDYKVTTASYVDLQLSKTESIDPVIAGSGADNLVYVVTVKNAGPSVANALELTEQLQLPTGVTAGTITASAGTSYLNGTWTVGTLAVNASATLTVKLTAGAAAVDGSNVICDTASVSTVTEARINLADDSATECTSIAHAVDLAIDKTESQDPVIAGSGTENLTYTIHLTNNGPSDASGVVVNEALTLPAGVTLSSSSATTGSFSAPSWNVGALAAGASATLTVKLTVGPSAAAGTDTICDTATVTDQIDPSNDAATKCTSVQRQIDLVVSKTDTPDPVAAGGTPSNLHHVVTVHNAGPSEGSGIDLSESITIPAGVTVDSVAPNGGSYDPNTSTWHVGTLAAGADATLDVTMTVSAAAAAGNNVICDTATVTASNEPRLNTTDDTDSECTSVTIAADLSIVKTDDADPPPAGANLTYTLAVHNAGPGAATGVVVHDTLPGATTYVSDDCGGSINGQAWTWTIGNLASNGNATCHLVVSINPAPPSTISNTANVSGNQGDPDTSNDSSTQQTTLDGTSPTVTGLDSLGGTGDGSLDQCETARVDLHHVVATFSEAMFDPAGDATVGDVTNPASYRLVSPGAGQPFATDSCADAPGTDTVIPISGVAYDPGTFKAALGFATGTLSNGLYRLLLCHQLRDQAGNQLDGGAGAGSDFVRTFRVDNGNWLAAGHFDTFDATACPPTWALWSSNDASAYSIVSPPDATGSPLSGSVHDNSTSVGFDLQQCATVPASVGGAELAASLRVDAPASLVSLSPTCTFYNAANCGGSALGSAGSPVLAGDTGGSFLRVRRTISVPAGTLSARCSFVVKLTAGSSYSAYLDRLFLGPPILFADSFESGNLNSWSGVH